jgi:hypothetical protein
LRRFLQEPSLALLDFRPLSARGLIQSICSDAIYWCFTDVLVKSDLTGKILQRVPVADHHGDLCFHNGKIYVAVNLGEFNQPPGKADSWVYVYDAETLDEIARYATPELVHGAGGIGYHDGRFLVVGGLPEGVNENFLYEYDELFRFQKRHVLDSGYTLKGIQTATFANGHWWFGCYGNPRVLLKADPSFRLVSKWEFDVSLGIVGLQDGRLLAATGRCEQNAGCTGSARPVVPDDTTGLKPITPSPRRE